MAGIVLVHGIGQERQSADSLEATWLPSLAGGVRSAGFGPLADSLWRDARPGAPVARMAFYGDLFRMKDQQGDDDTDLTDEQWALAEPLAREWLDRIAARGSRPADRQLAEREQDLLDTPGEVQGARAAMRPVLRSLARMRPFARFGVGFAERFLVRALRQVSLYLTDDSVRERALARVTDLIDEDTVVLLGHSLGSVVAYEAAHRLAHPLPLLVTIGSPLGIRTVVYDRLRPIPPTVPPTVRRWVNLVDPDDLVAAEPDLASGFPGPAGVLDSGYTVDNGASPHEATSYLTAIQTGRPVGEALTTP
ncbi:MAG TPA: hypothetical protein VH352_22230 [Pseudonocardiaceae bacterium]|nr:hypothetical protein [Pseudonocardiaceae bacterium]